MSTKQMIVSVLLLVVAWLALDSLFVVDERERIVVLQFGRIMGVDHSPGLHAKLPMIQRVKRFDDRILTLDEKIDRVLTSENKNLKVDYFVKWRITDSAQFYIASQGSEERALRLLNQIIENGLLDEFSERTIKQAVADDRNEIMAALKVKSNEKVKELGVRVVDVRIKRIDLPDKVSDSVYERMRSEREEVIKALRSSGEAKAREIRSVADRQNKVIRAEAYNEGQQIKGEGDATAAAIYANAHSRNSEFYSFYRSLQLYEDSMQGDDVLVLKPNSELFKYFEAPSGRK